MFVVFKNYNQENWFSLVLGSGKGWQLHYLLILQFRTQLVCTGHSSVDFTEDDVEEDDC